MLRHYFHLKPGSVPKWSNGADCKSAGLRLRGFESHLTHHPSLLKLRVARHSFEAFLCEEGSHPS